ncbi:sensor histidine kinase [Actinomadura flavalba]|uniref:sensor histidine kinase n=1 Tax=Actinomadura flavalba TaxID=1120938 RepID=UPI0003721FEF|nr:histidine kinase [Actinomadura flavalba]
MIAAIIVAMALVAMAGLLLPAYWYEVFERADPGRVLAATAFLGAIFALYGRLFWQNLMRRTARSHRLGLLALTVLCWSLPALFGADQGWGNALLAPAGLFAVVLPVRESTVTAGAVALAAPLYGALLGQPPQTLLYTFVAIPFMTFSGYVTVWFFHVVRELEEARAELARSAVGEERMRFARDLHDVLGHSLQAVALRAEVAERYLERDPGRVRKELAEIQTMARDAVRDVREVVRGHRRTSLRTELDGMTAVLRAAGIRTDRPEVGADLPEHVHEPLGWVAREATTNVLRHAAATWCLITVWADDAQVWVEITNDGAGRRPHAGGSGLSGLAERIAAAGGEFIAGPVGDGTFRVAASVPKGAS